MKFFRPPPKRILFTPDGYRKLHDDKAKLLAERPQAVEHLRKAREMGDLSENGYYKASRARLSFIDAQLRRLDRLIKLGKVTEQQNSGLVGFGSTVVTSINGKRQELTVVGSFESDPLNRTISHVSPLGKALLGKKAGDAITFITPKGEMEARIIEIK